MHLRNKFFILLFLPISLYGFYPEVKPHNNNSLFKQIQSDINENNRRLKLNKPILPVQLFTYEIDSNDTIFSVASRFNLSYETIATINKIDNQLFFSSYKTILIPTCPGIYRENPSDEGVKEVNVHGKTKYLHPGKSFSKKERLNFLVSPFKSPLKKTKITSGYGYRENPFTGRREFHKGLDLKATVGTKLYSPYKGIIKEASYSERYGYNLIIEHPMGYTSHYFHMNNFKVKKGDKVGQGDLVGKTGNSGRSTGPHLHFEIRLNDENINPSLLLGNV